LSASPRFALNKVPEFTHHPSDLPANSAFLVGHVIMQMAAENRSKFDAIEQLAVIDPIFGINQHKH
jgi:hypothetical protein